MGPSSVRMISEVMVRGWVESDSIREFVRREDRDGGEGVFSIGRGKGHFNLKALGGAGGVRGGGGGALKGLLGIGLKPVSVVGRMVSGRRSRELGRRESLHLEGVRFPSPE